MCMWSGCIWLHVKWLQPGINGPAAEAAVQKWLCVLGMYMVLEKVIALAHRLRESLWLLKPLLLKHLYGPFVTTSLRFLLWGAIWFFFLFHHAFFCYQQPTRRRFTILPVVTNQQHQSILSLSCALPMRWCFYYLSCVSLPASLFTTLLFHCHLFTTRFQRRRLCLQSFRNL